MITIAKMLRTGAGHFNDRDTAALNELKANFKLYMTQDIVMLDYLRLVSKRFKRAQLDQQKKNEIINSFMDVSEQVLKKSGVSKKDYDQIKMLMKLDKEIFMQEAKIHPDKNYLQENDFDHFVDFSRLPEKINKNAKMILYRPNLMAKLKKSFDAIVKAAENEEMIRIQEAEEWKAKKHHALRFQQRITPKPESELKIIQDLLTFMDEFFDNEDKQRKLAKQERREIVKNRKTSPEKFKLMREKEEVYYQNALQRLLKERRKVPKEERVKMRQDSVDEIDTTDLENWVLRENFYLVDKAEL